MLTRTAARLLLGLLALAAVLALVGLLWARRSLPRTAGRLEVAGLAAPIDIRRDPHGVPHITAGSRRDAAFGFGFVHAQDRLWQLELQRRIYRGRLAEAFGPEALPQDRFLRTLSVHAWAERTLANLDADTRALLDAYASGVNAAVAARRGPLPPEFALLGIDFAPYEAVDVVGWSKMMAWDLATNYDEELLRARLLTRLGAERTSELFPPYPGDAPVALPDAAALWRELPLAALAAASPAPKPQGYGSNAWALAGRHTASGRPLLANDPHLGLRAPGLWYLARLSTPENRLAGATLPGVPGVLLGRNEQIAWGFTSTGADVQDLFVERLDPADPGRYLTPEGSEPFETREELIAVKGAEPQRITVRATRHGPVISDVAGVAAEVAAGGRTVEAAGAADERVLALAWTALSADDPTVTAGLELQWARDWDEFSAALEGWAAPMLSMVYADRAGNVGLLLPGRIPRRAASDGLLPVPGWTGAHDWQGFVPFAELPRRLNPEAGGVVAANHKMVPDDYPHLITLEWTAPLRAERIAELLASRELHTADSFAAMQRDEWSPLAATFAPLLRATEPPTELARRALAELEGWTGAMDAGGAAPLLFSAWYRALLQEVLEDDLGELYPAYRGARPLFARWVLLGDGSHWCDDVRTGARESCAELASRALGRAVAELAEAHGGDPARWRWGDAHPAVMTHTPMSQTPLRPLFEIRTPNGGDAFTLDAAPFRFGDPFAQHHGPGYRAVYDLAEAMPPDATASTGPGTPASAGALGAPAGSRFVTASGQSGHPLSRRYRDLTRLWRDGDYLPLVVDGEAGRALRLEPRR